MNSREIIRRCIEFTGPERIGYDFYPHPSDMVHAGWGRVAYIYEEEDPSIRRQLPDAPGRLYRDDYGTIWSRLNDRADGQVVKGALQDGWGKLEGFRMPGYASPEGFAQARESFSAQPERYHVGFMPGMPSGIIMCMRHVDQFLMDLLLHEKEILRLSGMVMDMLLAMADRYAAAGADAILVCSDLGTQDRLLMSPPTFRKLFKPCFRALAGRAHSHNMHLIHHCCGYIHEIIPDLIEAGVDVLQLDQPSLLGLERLSREFGGRVAFHCPVDIQKVMQTGDKTAIQREAWRMVDLLGRFDGGFIAKDYPQWDAIDVEEEWAGWAREAFVQHGLQGGSE